MSTQGNSTSTATVGSNLVEDIQKAPECLLPSFAHSLIHIVPPSFSMVGCAIIFVTIRAHKALRTRKEFAALAGTYSSYSQLHES